MNYGNTHSWSADLHQRIALVARRDPGGELAGGLNDFARGMAADYRNLSTDDLRVILVHSRERILTELSESLVSYAMQRMGERGVTIRLNTRVTDAKPGLVTGAIFDSWPPFGP